MQGVALAILLLATPGAVHAAGPFDGQWGVVVSCPASPDGALGYVFRFDATVVNGTLHGQNSTEGAPGYLLLDGSIRPDGTADLLAQGSTANPSYAVGRVARSTPYRYTVQARFTASSGTGQRMTTRPCTLSFDKHR